MKTAKTLKSSLRMHINNVSLHENELVPVYFFVTKINDKAKEWAVTVLNIPVMDFTIEEELSFCEKVSQQINSHLSENSNTVKHFSSIAPD